MLSRAHQDKQARKEASQTLFPPHQFVSPGCPAAVNAITGLRLRATVSLTNKIRVVTQLTSTPRGCYYLQAWLHTDSACNIEAEVGDAYFSPARLAYAGPPSRLPSLRLASMHMGRSQCCEAVWCWFTEILMLTDLHTDSKANNICFAVSWWCTLSFSISLAPWLIFVA